MSDQDNTSDDAVDYLNMSDDSFNESAVEREQASDKFIEESKETDFEEPSEEDITEPTEEDLADVDTLEDNFEEGGQDENDYEDDEYHQTGSEEQGFNEQSPVEEAEDTSQDSGESNEIDYKAAYERLTAPFKASGREIRVNTVENAITLMQKGADYAKKDGKFKTPS